MGVVSLTASETSSVGASSPSGWGLRRRIAPRVRRATAEFSVMNPGAPKERQVRRIFLWCTLFSCGLFTSMLLLLAISLHAGNRPLDPFRLSDAQLLEQVGQNQLGRDVRVKALEEIGRRRLSELKNTPLLFDGPEINIAFAKASAQIGELALVPALMKQLDDSNPQVRSASAQALGVLGDKRTSEFLSLRAGREQDPAVREKMKAAIGALGGPTLGELVRK